MTTKKIIVYLIKNKSKDDMIKGPIISLQRNQSQIIVDDFKTKGLWTDDIIDSNPLVVESELLHQIFNSKFIDHSSKYYFSPFTIDEYFDFSKNNWNSKQLGLVSYTKSLESKGIVLCIGKLAAEEILKFTNGNIFGEILRITEDNLPQIFEHLSISNLKDFFEFDFENNIYQVEQIDLYDYIILSSEEWWGISDLTFLPLNFISY